MPPRIPVKSGSFMYDARFCFDWTPSEEELRLLSRVAARTQFLDQSRARIRSLNVDASVALKMFQDNPLVVYLVYNVIQLNEYWIMIYYLFI